MLKTCEKTENYVVLNSEGRPVDSWVDLKLSQKKNSQRLFEPHKLRHKRRHLSLPSPFLTVSYERIFSDSLSPYQPSSSLQLTSVPTTRHRRTKKIPSCHRPLSPLWRLKHAWTCPVKPLDRASMFQVTLRS